MPESLPETKFTIFSGMLKASDGEHGHKKIKTVASSTVVDKAGHEITKKAIDQMAASAIGMTIFLNHEYRVPEDVFGVVTDTKAVERGEVWDLDFDIDVEMDNPRAVATTKSIERGVKLGTSIGCLVKDAWKESGHLIIDDVELLEASIVGIPSNPRTWVQYAIKSYEDQGEELEWEAKFVGEEEPIEAKTADAAIETEQPEAVPVKDAEPEPETPAEAVQPAVAQEGRETDPESADADGPAPVAKEVAPAKEAMPASELEGEDPLGNLAKDSLAIKQADFTTLVKMIETTTHEVVETRKALYKAQSDLAAVEKERDEANANVALAQQFVNKLSELPIGRRASHATVIKDFNSKFGGIYDPDFLKMLTTGDDNA